jgi:hypothetical protein
LQPLRVIAKVRPVMGVAVPVAIYAGKKEEQEPARCRSGRNANLHNLLIVKLINKKMQNFETIHPGLLLQSQ